MQFKPDLVLKRAGNLTLKLQPNNIEIEVGQKCQQVSDHALRVLGVFTYPISVKDALEKLSVKSSQEWIKLTQIIKNFYNWGILVPETEYQVIPNENLMSFSAAPIHIAMLNDKVRTETFINAIKKIVKSGDVVLDIGTGTGVLAVAAARAGAKMVYAIEATRIADVAQAVINTTEVADKITIVRGWSTEIELPEKADVLVSEIIGNDPFAENVMTSFADARKRLLKPNADILPGGVKVFGLPVKISDHALKNKVLKNEYLENWKNWYGVDFSSLNKIIVNQSPLTLSLTHTQADEFEVAGSPFLLAEVDLKINNAGRIKNTVAVNAKQPFNGLLIYFELDVQGAVLTNHPLSASPTNHWLNPVRYLPEAELLQPGEKFNIEYSYESKHSEIKLITE